MIDHIQARPATPAPDTRRTTELREVAERLEASFLSEMLKEAGLGARKGSFGGGEGEDQFASLLREEQARQMVESGGIGLARHLFEALAARDRHV